MAQTLFEIDTKGTCLFCLNQNCVPLDRNKIDLTTATALKMLFRYLQIDLRKLANSSCGTLTSETFTNANLAASLCDACFFLVDEFLELFQDFERIRLQLEGCTWKLHELIGKGTKDEDRVREYQRRVQINRDELHSRFVEKLRTETSEKCSRNRCFSLPQISLRRYSRSRFMEVGSNIIADDIDIYPRPVKIKVEDFTGEAPTFPFSSTSMTSTSNKKYICDQRFTRTPPSIQIHHHNGTLPRGRTMKCIYCSRYFAHISNLKAHQYLVHPLQMLSKGLPPNVSAEEVNLALGKILAPQKAARNRNNYTVGGKRACPFCHELFSRKYPKLKLHILRSHKDELCQTIHAQKRKQGMSPSGFLEEVEEEEIVIQESPPPQGKPTSNVHLKQKYNIPRESCDICGKMLSKKNMNRHKNLSHGIESFKCDLCDKAFFLNDTLQQHLQGFHLIKPSNTDDSSSSPWRCDYCGKIYPQRKSLQHHLHKKHAMQLYASRIPSWISEHDFESALTAIVERMLPPASKVGTTKKSRRGLCIFCRKVLPGENTYLRAHLAQLHLEKVIESVEICGPADSDKDNVSSSSVVICKSEYHSSGILNQLEDAGDGCGFELEGEEHSVADEDPLGI